MPGQLNVTPPLQPAPQGATRNVQVGPTNLGDVQYRIQVETNPTGVIDNPGGGGLNPGGTVNNADNTDTLTVGVGRPLDFGQNQNLQLFDLNNIPLVNPDSGTVTILDMSDLIQPGAGRFGNGEVQSIQVIPGQEYFNPATAVFSPAQINSDGTISTTGLFESRNPITVPYQNYTTPGLTDRDSITIIPGADGNSTTARPYDPATDGAGSETGVIQVTDGPATTFTATPTQDAQRDIVVTDTSEDSRTDIEEARNARDVVETQDIQVDTVVRERTTELRTEVEEIEQPEPLGNTLDTVGDVLPHAEGAVRRDAQGNPIAQPNGDPQQTPYSQHTDAFQIEGNTSGVQATYQTAPLNSDPEAAPTLLGVTGRLRPPQVGQTFAELGITLTQYLQPTHRQARDMYGNPLENGDGEEYLVPTGINSDIQVTNYVPATPPGEIRNNITSQNGIFTLPQGEDIEIAPPNAQMSGPGDSAYNNAGLLLVERNDGSTIAVPQWTADGARRDGMSLDAGSASRVIHAIAPNGGAALSLDQPYRVNEENGQRYIQFDNGTRQAIIAADTDPANFASLGGAEGFGDVSYAVEDTRAAGNPAVSNFDGQRRNNVVQPDGSIANTVDGNDATVAAELESITPTPGEPGQPGIEQQTNAVGGFRASVTFGLGVGEQRVNETTITTTHEDGTTSDNTYRQEGTLTNTTPVVDINRTPVTTTTVTTDTYNLNQSGILVGNPANGNIDWDDPTLVGQSTSAQDLITRGPTTTTTEVTGPTRQDIELGDPNLINSTVVGRDSRVVDQQVEQDSHTRLGVVGTGRAELAYVQNFGNPVTQPAWTPAANQAIVGAYGQTTLFGMSAQPDDAGVFGRLVINPGGGQTRDAFDHNGNPLYQTEPVLDASGNPVYETIMGNDGVERRVAVNRFRLDEHGNRIPLQVGTGRANGPALFLQVDQSLTGNGTSFQGGVEFNF
ncbi:MAG: hypothetical protein SFZ03_00675 [Candidatus Melainabacteria bacterium]|nr:hypothetical protein [Candidatus Melainabacteria bacterium]